MSAYADTSFLTSIYLDDANNEATEGFMLASKIGLPLTEFSAFELRNAIWASAFRKLRTLREVEAALRQIDRDFDDGILIYAECRWLDVFRTAEYLSRRHTHVIGSRALDILHVTSAIVLGCTEFLTFDQRQAQLARDTGLITPL